MKTRKVSIDVLKEPSKPKAPSARELRRMELEGKLEQAIGSAKSDTHSAVKLILEQGELACAADQDWTEQALAQLSFPLCAGSRAS